jgi:hypothetical protein
VLWMTACLFGAWSGLLQAAGTLAVGGLDELGDASLSQAIVAYYEAEKAHDWQTTYALRGADFAAVVPFENYVRQMEIDAGGWELVAIDGRSVLTEGAVANVTLSFQEELAADVAQRLLGPELASPAQSAQGQRYSQLEVTQWILQDGQWLVLMPGARQHFVFNERMVWD